MKCDMELTTSGSRPLRRTCTLEVCIQLAACSVVETGRVFAVILLDYKKLKKIRKERFLLFRVELEKAYMRQGRCCWLSRRIR